MKRHVLVLILIMLFLVGCTKNTDTTDQIISSTESSIVETGNSNSQVLSGDDEITVSAKDEDEVIVPTADDKEKSEPTSSESDDGLLETKEKLPILDSAKMVKGSAADVGGFDNLKYFAVTKEKDHYYVGKQDSPFLADKKYDRVIYLSNPAYLLSEIKYSGKVTHFECSDTDIAEVIDGVFYPKKQGLVTLTGYNNEDVVYSEVVAVTTYNDGKKETATSFSNKAYGAFYDVKNPKLWKEQIHTILDMANYLQYRHWCYEFIEPDFPMIDMQEERWQWMPSGEVIAAYNTGVCVEVAQAACYMLEDDYEDWGVIWIFGKQGHIFNWFYEDGYYYAFDYTEVTSFNNDHRDDNISNFASSIHKFQSIEEIESYIKVSKVKTSENPLVVMLSCQGHDSIPCWLDPATGGFELYKNATEDKPLVFKWEKAVVEHESFKVLWKDDKYHIVIEGVDAKDVPPEIREQAVDCMYSDEYIQYYFAY